MMPHYTFECVPFGNDDPQRGSVIDRHQCEIVLMLGLNNKGGLKDELRNSIVEKARANPAVFNRVTRVKKKVTKDTTPLRFTLVSAHDIRSRSFEELTALINSRFETFMKAQHPLVEELLDSAAVKEGEASWMKSQVLLLAAASPIAPGRDQILRTFLSVFAHT